MGSFSITHWLILLAVVVVVFGTQKLRNAGKDLGGAVKGFKDAMKSDDVPPVSVQDSRTIDVPAQRTEQRDKI